jgi:polar amino acid transport system substrate-binding protein
MNLPDGIRRLCAPEGRLRACINIGAPVLARRSATDGEVTGVSVDLAQNLALCMGVVLDVLVVDSAPRMAATVKSEQADVGFLAIDPARAEGLSFTGPYVQIEAHYMVRANSPICRIQDVDRAGVRIVVGRGSACDMFLTRSIRNATLIRASTGAGVVELFLSTGADVAAGVLPQLDTGTSRDADLRLLPGRFMAIEQAMICSRTRGQEAAGALCAYVEMMKSSGFVAQALVQHCIQGVSVAPATPDFP